MDRIVQYIKNLAGKILPTLKAIADGAKAAYSSCTPERAGYAGTGHSDDYSAAIQAALRGVTSRNAEQYLGLSKEPAIARVVAISLDDDEEHIYYICRGMTVNVSGITMVSYRAPMGSLAAAQAGDSCFIDLPAGSKEFHIAENAKLRPDQSGGNEWDASAEITKDECDRHDPLHSAMHIESLRGMLDNEDALQDMATSGKKHQTIDRVSLPDQPVLDSVQDKIFRRPINSCIFLYGPPGTGKTTTMIKRLGQKLDANFLDETEKALLERVGGNANPKEDWIMFAPTELLRLYVQEAFNREYIAAPDGCIRTWDQFRLHMARNVFPILKSSNKGKFKQTNKGGIITEHAMENTGEWHKQWHRWQSAEFFKGVRLAMDKALERVATIKACTEEHKKAFGDILRDMNSVLQLAGSVSAGILKSMSQQSKRIRKVNNEILKYANAEVGRFFGWCMKYVDGFEQKWSEAPSFMQLVRQTLKQESPDVEFVQWIRGKSFPSDEQVKNVKDLAAKLLGDWLDKEVAMQWEISEVPDENKSVNRQKLERARNMSLDGRIESVMDIGKIAMFFVGPQYENMIAGLCRDLASAIDEHMNDDMVRNMLTDASSILREKCGKLGRDGYHGECCYYIFSLLTTVHNNKDWSIGMDDTKVKEIADKLDGQLLESYKNWQYPKDNEGNRPYMPDYATIMRECEDFKQDMGDVYADNWMADSINRAIGSIKSKIDLYKYGARRRLDANSRIVQRLRGDLLIRDATNANPLVSPIEHYVANAAKRYQQYRNEQIQQSNWYCPDINDDEDIHPLEVDAILLSIIMPLRSLLGREPGGLESGSLNKLKGYLRTQVLVDEASDFSPVQLACMANLDRPGVRSFFACGDFNQRTTPWGTSTAYDLRWAAREINEIKVDTHYRQSRLLQNFAHMLMSDQGDDASVPALEGTNNPEEKPVLALHMAGNDALAQWLAERIQEIEEALDRLPSIAVFVRNEDEVVPVADALRKSLEEVNIATIACVGGQIRGDDKAVRVFCIDHIKGLEFEAVFVVGLDRLAQDAPGLFDKYLYVAATRAVTYLGISCEQGLPDEIKHLQKFFGEAWGHHSAE